MQEQNKMPDDLSIKLLAQSRSKDFLDLIARFGFSDTDYYLHVLERTQKGEIDIVIADLRGEPCGYALLNWQPKYAYFKKFGLPEIQDLNVLRDYRRQGVGAQIIGFCENLAREKGHKEMGIGVGLDHTFGAAQRLYARLGYIPDGAGVTYDRKQVAVGEFYPIDMNLSLMMHKNLS